MGSGIRNFKKAMKEDEEEEVAANKAEKQVEQKSDTAKSDKPEEKKEA